MTMYSLQNITLILINSRGGVEDTRLEVKDTKQIRGLGQGQPYWRTDPLEAKTGMLEANAKDQGHKRKCSLKKRSSKHFLGDPQKKGLQKIFSGDLQRIPFFPKKYSGAPQTFNNSTNSAVQEPRTGQFLRT